MKVVGTNHVGNAAFFQLKFKEKITAFQHCGGGNLLGVPTFPSGIDD